ncbi:hypothetical protein GCM10015535_24290 [Streptomyces gelaticus]|uniref:Uncharacterized protein n=1 Tax=Streptomyces gelaticus TaxID=285446 RepID=A0ABQ2VYI2_9ACTN|nr:hypothetical protein GCM10015535_24290 [Streptomyces gelaticus]
MDIKMTQVLRTAGAELRGREEAPCDDRTRGGGARPGEAGWPADRRRRPDLRIRRRRGRDPGIGQGREEQDRGSRDEGTGPVLGRAPPPWAFPS